MTTTSTTTLTLVDLLEAAYGMDADDIETTTLVDGMSADDQTKLADKLDRALRDVMGLDSGQCLGSALSALVHFDVFVEDEISNHPVYYNYENNW